jgi:hypothetical protein
MTETPPERVVRAFDAHEAFDRDGDSFTVTTSRFGGQVRAVETDGTVRYSLVVRVPSLSATVEGETVGPAVEKGWFDTLSRRLEDAPGAVRQSLELDSLDVEYEDEDKETVAATFRFGWDEPSHVPAIAKALAEYLEGTYVEGIVPGYDYGPPVSELLSSARRSGGDGGSGDPMPL